MSQHCAQGTQGRLYTRWGCSSDLRAHAVPARLLGVTRQRRTAQSRQLSRVNSQAHSEPQNQLQWQRLLPANLTGAAAAAIIAFSGPACAEIQTVAPSEAVQRAQPIPQQTVNKPTVWLLFGGGAAAIFGSALLLEKNQRFFPAIYKANETMRRAKEADQGRALTEKAVVNLEQGDDMRLQRSVEAGLASAQARNLPEATSSKQQDSSEQTNEPSTSSTLHASPQKEQTKADMSSRDVDQPQEQPADYGKGSTMSDEDKQKAAVGSIK